MDHSPEPDAFEKGLRFGCGSIFGAAIAFLVALREVAAFSGLFWAVVAGSALVIGFLAMRYGDQFWHRVSDWFRSW